MEEACIWRFLLVGMVFLCEQDRARFEWKVRGQLKERVVGVVEEAQVQELLKSAA